MKTIITLGGICMALITVAACQKKAQCGYYYTEKDICCTAEFAYDGHQKDISIYDQGSGFEKYTFDATCDPCVAEVCKKRPSCCEEEWYDENQSIFDPYCADIAEEVCPMECGTEGVICCPFVGGYGERDPGHPHEDGHFNATCDPIIAQVCFTLPKCCTDKWVDACADLFLHVKWETENPCGGTISCPLTGMKFTNAADAVKACESCAGASLDCNGSAGSNICLSCTAAQKEWQEYQKEGICKGSLCHTFEGGAGSCHLR